MNSLSKHDFNYILVLASCTSELRPLGLSCFEKAGIVHQFSLFSFFFVRINFIELYQTHSLKFMNTKMLYAEILSEF